MLFVAFELDELEECVSEAGLQNRCRCHSKLVLLATGKWLPAFCSLSWHFIVHLFALDHTAISRLGYSRLSH